MSKFVTLLGGLVAIGTIAVLAVGGFSFSSSASAPASHVKSLAIEPACVLCIAGGTSGS
jgi:hypothetical protein